MDERQGLGSPPCESCLTPLTSPPRSSAKSPFCKHVDGSPQQHQRRPSHNKSLADLMQASTMLEQATPPSSTRSSSPPSPSASAQGGLMRRLLPSPPSPKQRSPRAGVRRGMSTSSLR